MFPVVDLFLKHVHQMAMCYCAHPPSAFACSFFQKQKPRGSAPPAPPALPATSCLLRHGFLLDLEVAGLQQRHTDN